MYKYLWYTSNIAVKYYALHDEAIFSLRILKLEVGKVSFRKSENQKIIEIESTEFQLKE